MRGTYCAELTHAIFEAEKSHNMPSASWRLRKANDVIPVQVWRPRNWGDNGINPSPRAGKDRRSSSTRKAEREVILPSSAFLFSLGCQGIGQCLSTLERVIYFTESTDSKANLTWRYHYRHTYSKCLIWVPHGLSSWHTKLTITEGNLLYSICWLKC